MFQIEDYNELMALHKFLMERHYKIEFHSDELVGSRFIAEISNRVVDSLIEIDEGQERFEKVKSWQNWRLLEPSRPEWDMLLFRIKNIGEWWGKHTIEERKKYILIFLSPYTVNSENMAKLLDFGDRNNGV
ncbi:hypothetical protein [Gimesia chilikensis]|uniref:hypothetical protein n=1 Tax=Gimesia chilikensis TaxID=2605989 RepID=UPI003A92B016